MTDKPTPGATVLAADPPLSLEELCRTSHVDAAWIMELVDLGVIEPAGSGSVDWRFESVTVVRVAKARRLQRDLSLNPSGIALVLELLEEIDALRARLRVAI